MLKKIILIGIFFGAYGSLLAQGQQWSAEKAKEWYAKANQQGYSKNDTWNNLTL